MKTAIDLKPNNVPTSEGFYIFAGMNMELINICDIDGVLVALAESGDSHNFNEWKGYWSDAINITVNKGLF